MLAEHRGDLPPAVDPAQRDLPAGHEAKEQDQCRVLGRQRALRLHAAPEFLVGPLDRIRGSQRLPLGAWEPEEREQFVTAFTSFFHQTRGTTSLGLRKMVMGRLRFRSGIPTSLEASSES